MGQRLILETRELFVIFDFPPVLVFCCICVLCEKRKMALRKWAQGIFGGNWYEELPECLIARSI